MTPLTDQLRDRIAEAIRPNMLLGLQDAELHDEPGTERINEWADWIAQRVTELVQPELDRLRAERDERTQFAVDTAADLERAKAENERLRAERNEFADRVDTLTAVAQSNARAHRIMAEECANQERALNTVQARLDAVRVERDRLRADLADRDAKLGAVGTAKVWRNEGGKEFLFADDIRRAIGAPTCEAAATPAPTTTP